MQAEYDLVINGGGMAGLALAAGLAHSNLRLAIIEAAPQAPVWQAQEFSVRVSALAETSRQLLESLGAWEAMQNLRVNPYQAMHVWDSQGTASINFSAAQAGVANLGYLVENSVIQLGLLAAVVEQDNLTIYPGVTLEALSAPINPQGVRQLKLSDGTQLTTQLLVGADGANSKVRRLAAFKTREWDYGHHALVTSLRLEHSHQNTAWQTFNSQGVIAFLPLNMQGDTRWCSLVWSTQPETAQELLSLSEPEFNQRLSAAFEGKLGQVEISQQRQVVPLRQRHATSYVQPGIALVADAAHTIHPLAGQGINLGFADVAALTKILHTAASKNQPLGSLSLLNNYQLQRQPDNLAMMLLMESFKRLFASSSLPVLLLRNLGMRHAESSPWLKRQLITQALGLRPLA